MSPLTAGRCWRSSTAEDYRSALIDIAQPAGIDTTPWDAMRLRIAEAAVSATTLRRRRDEWVRAGTSVDLAAVAVASYDAMTVLRLVTSPPGRGECTGEAALARGTSC